MTKLIRNKDLTVLLLLTTIFVASCGLQGDLYLPTDSHNQPASQPDNSVDAMDAAQPEDSKDENTTDSAAQ
jgi:predicted small lipoprotein YifL